MHARSITGRVLLAILIVNCVLVSCRGRTASHSALSVFAASSLSGHLDLVISGFEATYGVDVVVTYGSSSTLSRQLTAGAPGDLFLSANRGWTREVVNTGHAEIASDCLFSNRLAIVSRSLSDPSSDGTIDAGKTLAVGDPNHVPVGIYAKQALISMHMWDAMSPNLVPAQDARSALRMVEMGAVDMAIVYLSDAKSHPHLHIREIIDDASHDQIQYVAVLMHTAQAELARALVAELDHSRLVLDDGFTSCRSSDAKRR